MLYNWDAEGKGAVEPDPGIGGQGVASRHKGAFPECPEISTSTEDLADTSLIALCFGPHVAVLWRAVIEKVGWDIKEFSK